MREVIMLVLSVLVLIACFSGIKAQTDKCAKQGGILMRDAAGWSRCVKGIVSVQEQKA